ncbi:MAG: hypothetical protein ISR76_06825 [Planctomycetes bacterium]|nr:hypothetical protein [Planctomycetota bacterium]
MSSILVCALLALLPQGSGNDVLLLRDGRMLDQLKAEVVEGGYELTFVNGKVFVQQELVTEALLQGVEFVPRTEEEKAQFAAGKVPFEGKWVSAAKRERELQKRLAEKRATLEDYRAHEIWRNRYQEATKYFEFEHTTPPHVFERYRDLMEAYFKSFMKDWKVKQPKELGRLKVCFYADKDLFMQVSGAGPNTLGYFRFVEPLELNFYYDRLSPADTEEVMFHEANHYLQKLIKTDFSYPHFPGESVAEYYGASHYDQETGKIETGRVLNGRLTEVLNDIAAGEWMPLEKLITTERMYQHYTWGWALAHFLMNHPKHKGDFRKFVLGLAFDGDVKRERTGFGFETVTQQEVFNTFRRYLKLKTDEDVKKLEKEWHDYIKDDLKLEGTSGLEKAAFSAVRYGRPIRAKRLFQEAIDSGNASAMARHAYADLLSDDREYQAAVEQWQAATEIDPLIGRFYACRGDALIRLDKSENLEEGRRLIRLAMELDPDDRVVQFYAGVHLD